MNLATQKTLVTFLLDRTGSMEDIRDMTIGAFNKYLSGLKEDGELIEFTFLQFDSISIDKLYVAEPVANVPLLTRDTFVPRASTPLIDACYKTIKAVEKSLTVRDDKPNIVINFQTDGHENASTEHTMAELNALIKEKTQQGWQFNFMGASIDAYDQAGRMGIAAGQTVSYNSHSTVMTEAAFAASASNTRNFAKGLSANTAYSQHQKMASGDRFDPNIGIGSTGVGTPVTPPAATPAAPKATRGKKPAIVDEIDLG